MWLEGALVANNKVMIGGKAACVSRRVLRKGPVHPLPLTLPNPTEHMQYQCTARPHGQRVEKDKALDFQAK